MKEGDCGPGVAVVSVEYVLSSHMSISLIWYFQEPKSLRNTQDQLRAMWADAYKTHTTQRILVVKRGLVA